MVPLFLLAILVPLIAAQTTKTIRPCCYPQQWQAVIKDIGRGNILSTNKSESYDESGMVYYDFKNQRSFIKLEDKKANTHEHIFSDYRIAKEYRMVIVGSCAECIISDITKPLTHCIPQEARLWSTNRYGGGPTSLVVDTWTFPVPTNVSFSYKVSVTRDGCYPVTNFFIGTVAGVEKEQAQWLVDSKPILDFSVFKIPELCNRNRKRRCDIPQHLLP